MKSQLLKRRSRGAFVIVGYMMQMNPGPDSADEKDSLDDFYSKYALIDRQYLSSLTDLLRYLLKGMSLY